MEADKRRAEIEELAEMCQITFSAAQKALISQNWDMDQAVSHVLENPEVYKEADEKGQGPQPVPVPAPPVHSSSSIPRPLHMSDRSWQALLAVQRESEEAEALRKLKEEQQSLEAALEMMRAEEAAIRMRDDDDASSRALAEALLAEEKQFQQRAREEEEATKKLLEAERIQRQRDLDDKTYPCGICFSDYKIDSMYTLDDCSHRFCFDCLKGHVEARISDGEVERIRCPTPQCAHTMTYAEIKHVASKDAFSKFDSLLLTKTLEADPNLRYCPRPGCSFAMIAYSSSALLCLMVCPKCKFSFCSNCMVEWHGDATCDQYQQWKRENADADNRFENWAQAHTKPCPKCQSRIEKNGGCNHMTCRKCHYEFCWTCGADYKVHGTCEEFS